MEPYNVVCWRSMNRYNRLIEMYRNYDGPGELHHIKPRSMFPDEINTPENIIKLPLRAHWLAHYLLWKSFRNSSMTFAFQQMCRTKEGRHKKSRLYAAMKSDFIAFNRGKTWWHNPETKEYQLSKDCPPGYQPGTGVDPRAFTPKNLFWCHNPKTGERRRVLSRGDIPEEWLPGRGKWDNRGFDDINTRPKKLNLISKSVLSTDEQAWYLIESTGQNIDEMWVLVYGVDVYITLKSCPSFITSTRKKMKDIPNMVVKPPNAKNPPATFEYRKKWKGKTYGESGWTSHKFTEFEFNDKQNIHH